MSSKRKRIQAENSDNDDIETFAENFVRDDIKAGITKDSGTIKKIKLVNFLCHENLELDLGQKQVNFITGRNGSGKSAVLAGIVVGLGGKASLMNRAGSVGHYVKTGCNFAEISLVFHNEGVDAFKPSEYGDTIIIERKIFATGTGGGYKIKGVRGVVAQKYEEIVKMMDHFNIQLDNPITVLSQDNSRQFLQSMKPTSLYEFFTRATQLDDLQGNLTLTQKNIDQAQLIYENRSASLPKIRTEVKKLKARIQCYESLQKLRDDLSAAIHEFPWAKYYEQEKLTGDFQKGLEEINEMMQKEKSQKETVLIDIDKGEMEVANLSGKINDFSTRLIEANAAFGDADQLYKKAAELAESKNREIGRINADIGQQNKEIADLRRQIAEANDPNVELRADKNAKEMGLQNMTVLLDSKKQELAIASVGYEKIEQTVHRLNDEKDGLFSEKTALEYNKEKNTRNLRTLEASVNNQIEKFGRGTQNLLSLIENASDQGRFKRKPKGPLGNHVKMHDPKWTLAAETCLGKLCYSYVCDNYEDSQLLEDLMKQAKFVSSDRPQIIVTSFGDEKPYNVDQHTVRCKQPTLLSVLDVNDAMVRNVLIDQANVETVVLFEDNKDMRDVMRNNPPGKVTVAYSEDGAQCFPGSRFRFNPCFKDNPTLLGGSTKENVDRLRGDLKVIFTKLHEIDPKIVANSSR